MKGSPTVIRCKTKRVNKEIDSGLTHLVMAIHGRYYYQEYMYYQNGTTIQIEERYFREEADAVVYFEKRST